VAFGTAGEVIADAANELALGVYEPSSFDPWASSDPNISQMIALMKSAGRSLVRERNWTYLRREHSFTTVAGIDTYDWPAGFLNMIDQTGWVRTTRLPMSGPLSPQEWQYMKARLVGATLTLLFRPMEQQLHIFPDAPNTPGDMTIAFEYQHSLWISVAATPTVPSLDAPVARDDTVWFDSFLMSRRLKLEFLKAKGFDTTQALQDYKSAFDLISNDDTQAPIINLAKRGDNILMGERNVPITGFGP
jgi:hypothetical protein